MIGSDVVENAAKWPRGETWESEQEMVLQLLLGAQTLG
jgi:hypothetical protein